MIPALDKLIAHATALELHAREADDPTSGLYAIKLMHHLEQAKVKARALETRARLKPKTEV